MYKKEEYYKNILFQICLSKRRMIYKKSYQENIFNTAWNIKKIGI